MEVNGKLDIIWDMETSDPDDFLTLCMLCTHPRVNLRAVTVVPGTRDQIGLVKQTFAVLNIKNVPVGAHNPAHNKNCVSAFHLKVMKIEPADPDGLAPDVMYEAFRAFPHSTIVTGAALTNLADMLKKYPDIHVERWVAQGGFAGDNVVPEQHRMSKFAGKVTCPTFNFGGNSKAAKLCLESPRIGHRTLVSKNVCHGVVYNPVWHEKLAPFKDNNPGFALFYSSMTKYLENNQNGKALHDPLAACVAIKPDIIETRQVEMYSVKGEWGANLKDGTNTFISIAVNKEEFMKVLTGQ